MGEEYGRVEERAGGEGGVDGGARGGGDWVWRESGGGRGG